MASRSSAGLILNQAAGIQNIFVNDWNPRQPVSQTAASGINIIIQVYDNKILW
jgi:putative heme degradation protein